LVNAIGVFVQTVEASATDAAIRTANDTHRSHRTLRARLKIFWG